MSGAQFTDGTTPLNASTLNALAVAPSYLVAGTTPATSGTLTLTIPAQKCVVNPSAAPAVYLAMAPTTQPVTATRDTYFDLLASGTYTLVAVANGAIPPALTADSLRLWKVVSGASTITSVTLLAPQSAFATPTSYNRVDTPNAPGGVGLDIHAVVTTWQQADVAGQSLATTLPCSGARSVLLLCTFRYNRSAAAAPECHFDFAISPTAGPATTSVTGLTGGSSPYTATSGLKAVQANYVGDVTVAYIATGVSAGVHRVELWAALASSALGLTSLYVEGVSFLAIEL